jgi:acyl-CoA thioester hydrolase
LSDDAPFGFAHGVNVRFKDVDIGGHVHHSYALVYMEEARAAYWREVVGRSDLADVDYILAEARLRYHRRVLYPQRLRVGVRVSRLGKRHFEMDYEVRGENGELLVSGSTLQVMYDYDVGATKSMPPDIRRAIEAQDGPFGPGGRPQGGEEPDEP